MKHTSTYCHVYHLYLQKKYYFGCKTNIVYKYVHCSDTLEFIAPRFIILIYITRCDIEKYIVPVFFVRTWFIYFSKYKTKNFPGLYLCYSKTWWKTKKNWKNIFFNIAPWCVYYLSHLVWGYCYLVHR